MKYQIELKPKAINDLKGIPKDQGKRIVKKLKRLESDLEGDVKRLTNYTPEYRLRVGDWRILFEVEKKKKVKTHNDPFFIPAQKTYLSCRFKEAGYSRIDKYGGLELIHCEYRGR